MGKLNESAAIIGVGITEFGEHFERQFHHDFAEAGIMALNDAGIEAGMIEEMYIGNMSAGRFIGQDHMASILYKYLAFDAPITRVEAACASGGLALRQAALRVESGAEYVVAAGIERMTEVPVSMATDILAGAADREFEGAFGVTFPALYGMIALAHMDKYGTTEEQFAQVAVKNHKNGAKNPHAQFRREITIDEVMNSSMIASPIRLLHSSPLTDGAAVAVLTSYENALELKPKDEIVKIVASEQAHDTPSLYDRRDITTFNATVKAVGKAYKVSGTTPDLMDFAEVHDCFSPAEIIAIEDLGFCKKGEGGAFVEEGYAEIGSIKPVNPSGGLKACGHPVGATGIKQAVEATFQLRGDGGKRQVEDAEYGLTHNVGGSGGTAVVTIYKRGG